MEVFFITKQKITKISTSFQISQEKAVAIYARVSTAQETQAISLENQTRGFDDLIKNQLGWRFAGIYIDKTSGRGIKYRKEFN